LVGTRRFDTGHSYVGRVGWDESKQMSELVPQYP
jgi:hypothetical protein